MKNPDASQLSILRNMKKQATKLKDLFKKYGDGQTLIKLMRYQKRIDDFNSKFNY